MCVIFWNVVPTACFSSCHQHYSMDVSRCDNYYRRLIVISVFRSILAELVHCYLNNSSCLTLSYWHSDLTSSKVRMFRRPMTAKKRYRISFKIKWSANVMQCNFQFWAGNRAWSIMILFYLEQLLCTPGISGSFKSWLHVACCLTLNAAWRGLDIHTRSMVLEWFVQSSDSFPRFGCSLCPLPVPL